MKYSVLTYHKIILKAIVFLGGFFVAGLGLSAQTLDKNRLNIQSIGLKEAQDIALKNYPSMRAARLHTQSQQALTPSAFDLGETELSTGGEEIGKGNEATYTLIALRQNFDIFSIGAKKSFLQQQVKVAEAEEQVLEREIMRQVGIDYIHALVAHHRTQVYMHLDSIYSDFEKAAKWRYETGATSQLEYISAHQQTSQNRLALRQALMNEKIALQNLNRWLGEKASYCPKELILPDESNARLAEHPSVSLAREKVRLAEQQMKAERAEFLPKLYVQGGAQKIGDKSGYWQYEVGVSLPLFSKTRGAKAKSGQLQREAEQARLEQTQLLLQSELQILKASDEKWSEQLNYYREVELPLAHELQRVAIRSYQQGAISYMDFIQNIKEGIKVQLDYWDTYREYFSNRMNMLYY
ncbi:TolC family protein [Segatella bryantii]|uniref:TolC family protein n=1 Tax=Segatella bryantii TaxID=77095 RepID=UPI002430B33F|nr:TolC family protein [Segatella bryantii]